VSFVGFSNENSWITVGTVSEDLEVLVDVGGCANGVSFVEFVQMATNVVFLVELSCGELSLGSLEDFLTSVVSGESHAVEVAFKEDVGVDGVW